MLAERHVGQVEQPAGPKIVRIFTELFHQEFDGTP